MAFHFNPSLWFFCKLCRESFPDTDKLKAHKLQSHLGDCLNIKCIIFEEKLLDHEWVPPDTFHLYQTQKIEAKNSTTLSDFRNEKSSQVTSSFNNCAGAIIPVPVTVQESRFFQNPFISVKSLTTPDPKLGSSSAVKSASETNNGNNNRRGTKRTLLTEENQISTRTTAKTVHHSNEHISSTPTDTKQCKIGKIDLNILKNEIKNKIVNDAATAAAAEVLQTKSSLFAPSDTSDRIQFVPTFYDMSPLSAAHDLEFEFPEPSTTIFKNVPAHTDTSTNVPEISACTEFDKISHYFQINGFDTATVTATVTDTDGHPKGNSSVPEVIKIEAVEDYDDDLKFLPSSILDQNMIISEPELEDQISPAILDSILECGLSTNNGDECDIALGDDKDEQPGSESGSGSKPTPFKCEVCKSVFRRKHGLRQHMKCHSEDRPFKCPQCPSAYKHRQLLKKHLIIHGSPTPFQCNFCGISMYSRSLLDDHERTHTKIRPFKCIVPNCSDAFPSKTALTMHSRRKHCEELGLQKFDCPICGRAFGLRWELNRHIQLMNCSS